MKQHSIDLQNEFQPVAEEPFFDEQTVQRIPAVVPLDETPTRTSARRFRQLRVPMRKADNSFNPAFLIMALVAVTALGVIAGTLVYRTASENRANNAANETDDPVNRTIPAQYQFVVKPETGETKNNLPKDNLPSDNLGALPSSSAPEKRDSRENRESSTPEENENQQQPAEQNKEVVEEETQAGVSSDELEEPPPPPMRRDRKKEDKKQDKNKQQNKNDKPEPQEEKPPVDESSESSEN